MTDTLQSLFHALVIATLLGVPAYAFAVRGRLYAAFALTVLLFSLPGAIWIEARLLAWLPPALQPLLAAGYAYGMAVAGLQLAHLVRARLRSRAFRALVSIPGQVFLAAGFLSLGWLLLLAIPRLVLAGLGADTLLRWSGALDLVPLALAVASLVTSVRAVPETVRIRLGSDGPEDVQRIDVERHRGRIPAPLPERPLRIVQITDPHIGPWQSIASLRRRIQALIDQDPDLVLMTGDYLTMESMGTSGALAESLAPLKDLPGRCFAIFGNHDYEAPDEVKHALAANDVTLLIDEEAIAPTPVGPVQIVGADWVRKDREAHLDGLLARFPRRDGHVRLLLLHDPSAFVHVPAGEADLTLSGHTHGGQVGLVSFGLDWTVLARSRWPDHGLFARGSNRLYVHRGTGFYGFPLRVGVPGEASLLELIVPGV